MERLQKDWPDEWQSIARENDKHPPMTLRVNLQKISVAEYLHALNEKGMDAQIHPIAPEGITLVNP